MRRALTAVTMIVTLACVLVSAIPAAQAAKIPSNPNDIKYPPLKFDVPDAAKYQFKLSNGIVVYIGEDHALPLVTVSVIDRAGAFLDPTDKIGLASLTGTMMREGGTEKMAAEEYDEKVAFLAANISSFGGDTQSGATLNCLSSVLDPSLDLFFDMIKAPRFQDSRLEVEKGNILEEMKQRNDDAGTILGREWRWLMYGDSHFTSRQSTKKTLDAIGRDSMIDFHKKYWQPANMIIAVGGDVNPAALIANLNKRFEGWKSEGPAVPWPPPSPSFTPKPGLYHVEKDIPQGKVYIGHLGTKWDKWDNPDNFALMVMNDILGGGGFTSRITKKVRSDEGLAYSAGSRFGIETWWPGDFRVSYQSKSATVALAAKFSYAEIKRIRSEPVTDEELTTAKASFIDTFPRNFESKATTARLFAGDDYIGRPHSYWTTYRANIQKVSPADVQRVAMLYLNPDRAVFLIVGKWADIAPGDADKRASMAEFNGGNVTHLPLRDPLTLEPMPQ